MGSGSRRANAIETRSHVIIPLDSRSRLGCASLLGRDPARIREARLLEIRSARHRRAITRRSTRARFIDGRGWTGLCALGFNSIDMARKLLLRNMVPLVSFQDILHDFGHARKLVCIDRHRLRLVGQGVCSRAVGWVDRFNTGLQSQHGTLAFDRRPTRRVLLQSPCLARSRSYLSWRLFGGNDLSQLLAVSKYLIKKLGAPAHCMGGESAFVYFDPEARFAIC